MIAGKQGCSPGHSSEEQSLVNVQCPVPSTTEDCGDAEEDGGAQKGPEGGVPWSMVRGQSVVCYS